MIRRYAACCWRYDGAAMPGAPYAAAIYAIDMMPIARSRRFSRCRYAATYFSSLCRATHRHA